MENLKTAFVCCVLIIAASHASMAQKDSTVRRPISENPDTVYLESTHSPTKASLYSMALPGLGQAYNKKYWKIPLVYAGIGIPLYYGIIEQRDFKDARNAYRKRLNNDTTDQYRQFSDAALLELVDLKRYNRDLLFIISSLVYVLNIVDASVDAHFFDFDVSDDLSLHLQPSFYQLPQASNDQTYMKGMTLTLKFK